MPSCHVAYLQLFNIDPLGNVVDKNLSTTTYKQMMNTQISSRVIADSSIPNTLGNPDLKSYLIAEAAVGFVLNHLDQSIIITYSL